MSSAINTPLPLRQPEAAALVPRNLVSNKNLGAGVQKNFSQMRGSHNTQFNAETVNYYERTRTPPPPSSTVPFHRDPHFVDRPQLEELEEKLSVWNKSVALVGLGGVGKSQLATELCYRTRDRLPEVWTFWVHASSAARFDADIRKLACDAGIPGCDDPKSDAFALVYSWLRDKRNGKWILVLDNVDDSNFLFMTPDVNEGGRNNKVALRNRIAYLPPCAHGSTLITSRSRAATARLTDECDVIAVSPMGEAAALALLEKKLEHSGAIEDMRKLATALDHMPLALAQAGAYIKQRGLTYSIRHYLARLEENEKSQTSLLTLASKQLRRDKEAQDSIILTWQISFDHIRATRPSAADLLSLMSMYNYQGIPEHLLRAEGSATQISTRIASSSRGIELDCDASTIAPKDRRSEEDDFGYDVLTLQNFLLISTKFSNASFEMHRLVQLAARVWLRSHGMYQEWVRVGCRRLDKALPSGEHENWERCEALYPHVESILSLELDDQEYSARRASVRNDATQVDRRRGLRCKAKALLAKVYNARADQAMPLLQASLQYNAAWFDWRRGLWSKAEALVAKSLNTRQMTLGLKNNEALSALNLYASVLGDQGKYEAAEEANRQVLEVFEKVLGKEHPSTLISLRCLADLMERLGRKHDELSLYERVVTGLSISLGVRHLYTLQCQGSLERLQRQS